MNDTKRKSIEQVISGLSQEIVLIDIRGLSLMPASSAEYYLPGDMQPGETRSLNGYLFLRLRGDEGFSLLTLDNPQGGDLLRLAALAIDALERLNPPKEDAKGACRRLLTQELSQTETDALLKDHDIPQSLPRCVMLLRLPAAKGSTAYEVLADMVPLSQGDILTPLDSASAALIKALDKGLGADEAQEFARALQDTLREETGRSLLCGVGDTVSAADGLRQSFLQAQRALDIGQAYPNDDGIYVWRRMLLPRFMSEIPADSAQTYYSLLFNKKTATLFTQEMLDTVDMFLKKDLNLSDTARQLYIHRNTLVYRLDKVQRLSGLDLRHFDDAFAFKLFFSLKRHIASKTPRPQDR